jgi:flagellar hook-length control protein FliK
MQTGIQMFDLQLQGLSAGGGSQKIAVKMPLNGESAAADNPNGFAAIMNALTALSSEELRLSLNGLDWVPLEGAAGQLVPLIDMTAPDDSGFQLVSQLLESAVQGDLIASLPVGTVPALSDGTSTEASALFEDTETALMRAPERIFPAAFRALDTPKAFTPPLSEADTKPVTANSDITSIEKLGARAIERPDSAEAKVSVTAENDVPLKSSSQTPTAGQWEPYSRRDEKAPLRQVVVPKTDFSIHKPVAASPLELFPESQFKPVSTVEASANPNTPVQPGLQAHAAEQITGPVALPAGNPALETNKTMLSAARLEFIGDLHVSFGRDDASDLNPHGGQAGREQMAETPARLLADPMERSGFMPGEKSAANIPRETAADIMRQIVARMTMRTGQLQSQMQIRLKPEFLGDVRLQITTENHQVIVRISAESQAVKEMIEQNVISLKKGLQQHGLQIDKFDVFVGNDDGTFRRRQQPGTAQHRPHARHGRAQRSEYGTIDAVEVETQQSGTGGGAVDFFA